MHQHQHLSMLPQPSGCGDLYHGNPAEYLLRTNPIQRRDHPGAAILSQQFIKNEPNSTPQPSRSGDLYHGNPAEYLLRTNPIQSRTFHLTALPCASQARPAKEKKCCAKKSRAGWGGGGGGVFFFTCPATAGSRRSRQATKRQMSPEAHTKGPHKPPERGRLLPGCLPMKHTGKRP